jgi:hypothetical protein
MRRERLPNRRPSEFFSIEAMALRFSVSASRYPDGRLGAPCVEIYAITASLL